MYALRDAFLSLILALALLLLSLPKPAEGATYVVADSSTWSFAPLATADGGHTNDDDKTAAADPATFVFRRSLAGRQKFISYNALNKNSVPCTRRGNSYYDCQLGQRANPYRRSCTIITRCARDLD